MAKRKRLSPARGGFLDTGAGPLPPAPPISQIAGDAAEAAALAEIAGEMRAAREGGRMVVELPLGAIDAGHLVRDRLGADPAEMEALVESLRARGQQTPLDVVDLGGGRYGLISGWRRLTALRRLDEEAGGHPTALCLLRRPEGAAEAYVAMVEENEIRAGLSYYERARIAAVAVEQGVYPDAQSALRGLYASASRAKRSKIGAFMRLHDALGDVLSHGPAIPERLGLSVVKALDAPGAAGPLRAALSDAGTPEAELAALAAVSRAKRPAPEPRPAPRQAAPVEIAPLRDGGLAVTGPGVDAAFEAALRRWIAKRR